MDDRVREQSPESIFRILFSHIKQVDESLNKVKGVVIEEQVVGA